MKRIFVLAVLMACIMIPARVWAQELIATYNARLSSQDHFSSKGVRLRSAAAIMRQDRANYHKFGKRDPGDEWDSFFASKSNRAKMERMLARVPISKSIRNDIVNGTPHVTVKIYGHGNRGTNVRVVVH